jgi:type II secretory pathway component PulF
MSVMESVEQGWSQIQTKILQIRFSKEQQVEFLQDLIDSLPHVGTPMPVLIVLEKYAQGGRKVVAQQMMHHLKAGQPLAEAMVGWFDPLLVNATRVGEKEGVLVESLKPVLKSMANNTAGLKQA